MAVMRERTTIESTVCHQQVDNTPNPKCHVLRKILEKSQKSIFGKSVLRDYWELGVRISRGIALSDKFLENKFFSSST